MLRISLRRADDIRPYVLRNTIPCHSEANAEESQVCNKPENEILRAYYTAHAVNLAAPQEQFSSSKMNLADDEIVNLAFYAPHIPEAGG